MTALPEQETTIPYGAIIDNVRLDRDEVTFSYLSEPYRCTRETYDSAVVGAKAAKSAAAPAAVAAPAAKQAPTPEPEVEAALQFESLAANVKGLSRAKVPGGWLIATAQGSVTFYPDPQHSWNGETAS